MVPNIKSLIPVYISGKPEPLPQGFHRVDTIAEAGVILCLFGWQVGPDAEEIEKIKTTVWNHKTARERPVVQSLHALDLVKKYWNKVPERKTTWGIKLDPEKVREIRAKHRELDISQAALAKEYGVSEACIWGVLRRITWKNVN